MCEEKKKETCKEKIIEETNSRGKVGKKLKEEKKKR